MLFFTETWLTNLHINSHVSMNGFKPLRADRTYNVEEAEEVVGASTSMKSGEGGAI